MFISKKKNALFRWQVAKAVTDLTAWKVVKYKYSSTLQNITFHIFFWFVWVEEIKLHFYLMENNKVKCIFNV